MNKAVFLDRDGTISTDGIINSVGELSILPGAAEALSKLQKFGYKLVVVTNQGGLSLGHITQASLEKINHVLYIKLAEKGVFIDMILSSGWHERGAKKEEYLSAWRKPSSGMIEYARSFFDIDPHSSFMVGDRESDVLSGRESGCRTFLIDASDNVEKKQSMADYIVSDLNAACRIILSSR